MDLIQWFTDSTLGKLVQTFLVAMLPVVELRGAIPYGHSVLGLGIWPTFFVGIAGNMLPIPFIIVYIRRVFKWMRLRLPKLDRVVDSMERKAHLKGRTISKYQYLGLFIFVAIPLPGTGAWTGALVAAFLDMRLRRALPAIGLGVLVAGVAISALTFGVTELFR